MSAENRTPPTYHSGLSGDRCNADVAVDWEFSAALTKEKAKQVIQTLQRIMEDFGARLTSGFNPALFAYAGLDKTKLAELHTKFESLTTAFPDVVRGVDLHLSGQGMSNQVRNYVLLHQKSTITSATEFWKNIDERNKKLRKISGLENYPG